MRNQKHDAPALLRKWRKEKKLTQAQASDLIGTSNVQWCLWERGRVTPNIFWAFEIEDATGVPARAWAEWEAAQRQRAI